MSGRKTKKMHEKQKYENGIQARAEVRQCERICVCGGVQIKVSGDHPKNIC
jgi:hypothetical protein